MQENELLPGIFAVGFGLWAEKDKALVIADLHLGIEEMFNKGGTMMPRFNFKTIKKHIAEIILSKVKPETIVINGDLKHEFGTVSEQEWSETIDMLRFLQSHCKKIVLVKGNHDTILGPIAAWENLKIEKEGFLLSKSSVFVTHGENIPKKFEKAKAIAIGHEHCAITIRDKYKEEQFKCFLVGKFKGRNIIAMPSMNSVSIGSDVRNGERLSPFLKQGLENFKVFASADKVYDFGLLKDLE